MQLSTLLQHAEDAYNAAMGRSRFEPLPELIEETLRTGLSADLFNPLESAANQLERLSATITVIHDLLKTVHHADDPEASAEQFLEELRVAIGNE